MQLNTQISEYDCATTTLLNAISFLYARDEIPSAIIKIIYKYTLDCKVKIIGDCGTTKRAMKKITKKINSYSRKHYFDLHMNYLTKENCSLKSINACLNKNGVVIVRSLLDLEHYYLITGMDDEYCYIWDPYSEKEENNIYNIKLKIKEVENEEKINYSFGPIKQREFILVYKTN